MVAVEGVLQPDEAALLVRAAQELLREHGLGGVTVAEVLSRTDLGTRAFYRHFSSKDHLLLEAFADATYAEVERLRTLMAPTADPVTAVAAWIEGRLDLAFDGRVESDLKHLSEQARALYAVAPETMSELHAAMMLPLVDQVIVGQRAGDFAVADPGIGAQAIASVVWACVEREWSAPSTDPRAVRAETLAFCLRALGAPVDRIPGAKVRDI